MQMLMLRFTKAGSYVVFRDLLVSPLAIQTEEDGAPLVAPVGLIADEWTDVALAKPFVGSDPFLENSDARSGLNLAVRLLPLPASQVCARRVQPTPSSGAVAPVVVVLTASPVAVCFAMDCTALPAAAPADCTGPSAAHIWRRCAGGTDSQNRRCDQRS
jgi:hypothetical protein